MARTFVCPHCEKQYPALPVLVGRKVRCSGCRELFQLAFDGIAKKVGSTQTSIAEPDVAGGSALEAKPGNQKATLGTQQPAAKSRPQAGAIKRKTERIKRMRESLQQATAQAIDSIEETAPKDVKSERELSAQATTTHSSVILGNERPHTKNRLGIFAGSILVMCACAFILLQFTESSPEQAALSNFSATVGDDQRSSPQRMNAYRDRMWLYTRDGVHAPPVVLNADDSEVSAVVTVDWTQVVSSCLPVLEGLEKNPYFAAYFEAGKAAEVQEVWLKHQNNIHIEEFYLEIERRGISCLRFNDLYDRMVQKGLTREAMYVASLLLAGTSSLDGMPCRNMGLQSGIMPELMVFAKFSGKQGIVLMEAEEGYRYVTAHEFSGLIVGFTGFPGRQDEWRVLDVRLSQDMGEFFTRQHNPLRRAAKFAHQTMADDLLERRKRMQ